MLVNFGGDGVGETQLAKVVLLAGQKFATTGVQLALVPCMCDLRVKLRGPENVNAWGIKGKVCCYAVGNLAMQAEAKKCNSSNLNSC